MSFFSVHWNLSIVYIKILIRKASKFQVYPDTITSVLFRFVQVLIPDSLLGSHGSGSRTRLVEGAGLFPFRELATEHRCVGTLSR